MKTFEFCSESNTLKDIPYIPSPNQDDRPGEQAIDLLVIHSISLPPKQYGGPFVEQLFLNQLDPDYHPYFKTIEDLKVSSHLFIRRNGDVTQFVPFHKRAWHAGDSSFEGRDFCNDFSIGIELEGDEETPYTQEQYDSLVSCTVELFKHYPLKLDRIVSHSDISPGRKTDPGPSFDWALYKGLLANHGLQKVG